MVRKLIFDNDSDFVDKIRKRNFLTNFLETLLCVYISMITENFNVSCWKSREIAKVAWVKIKRSDFEQKKSGKKIHDFFHQKIFFRKKISKTVKHKNLQIIQKLLKYLLYLRYLWENKIVIKIKVWIGLDSNYQQTHFAGDATTANTHKQKIWRERNRGKNRQKWRPN